MASRKGVGGILLRITAVTIAVLVGAFIASALMLRAAIVREIGAEENLRRADLERAVVLDLQLDEETGLRGFALTRNRSFLLPLRQARERFPGAMRGFEEDLRAIDPAAVALAQREQDVNARWYRAIPERIVSNPRADTIPLEIRGKTLMDEFRLQDDALITSLEAVAARVDTDARTLVARIVAWSITLGALLFVALTFYVAAQARMLRDLRRSTEAYERERNASQLMQDAFLLEMPPRVGNLVFDAVYASAQETERVGGDWHGVFKLPDGRVFVTVGDVAGHGLQAAVAMARARQTLLALASYENSPSAALAKANDVLRMRSEAMITALCGFIDPVTRVLTYASAGHPPPLLVVHGEGRYLDCEGTALGVAAELHARDYAQILETGSMLVMYTDGIVEFDRDLSAGERRLRDAACSVAAAHAGRPASAILTRVLGNVKPRDDIAVLTVAFVEGAAS